MTHLLSKHGEMRVLREIEDKKARYARVCAEREAAYEQCGDGWHDNPEFNRLQQLEAALNHDIHRLASILEQAARLAIDEQARPCDRVQPGSIVELEITDEKTGRSERALWTMGGDGDTDTQSRILGWDSPMARAIALGSAGDIFEEVRLGARVCTIEILGLHARWPAGA